ncbi:MAG: YihY family inner membrane protein [Deltaproteobacteria bacterium]|nr:YihY family inner membrane protein [Deltaproteobacteria bacterium]
MNNSTKSQDASVVHQHDRGLLRVRNRLQEIQRHDLNTIESRFHRVFFKIIQVLLLVGRLDIISRLQLHAQALTYDTMLAIVPLLAIVFAVVSGFGGLADLRIHLEELILNNISAADEVRAAVGDYLHRVFSSFNTGTFSAISIVVLIYSVLSLLGHIEFSINNVFGTKSQRPWLSRLITYWALLTLGPVLLGASFALTAALQSSSIGNILTGLGFSGILIRLLPLIITWIAFASIYAVVPNIRVRPSAAIFAAVVAGSLWALAKFLYAIYAKRYLSVQNIYGSLAAVPLFILWIYVSWLLVLLGAQLAFAYQHASTYAKETQAQNANQAYRERVACRTFLEIAYDFFLGNQPTDPDRLAKNLDIPRRLIEAVVANLKIGGFVHEVEGGGLLPAKDISQVSVADIINLMRVGIGVRLAINDDHTQKVLDELLDSLDRDLIHKVGDINFRDLIQSLDDTATSSLTAEAQGENTLRVNT